MPKQAKVPLHWEGWFRDGIFTCGACADAELCGEKGVCQRASAEDFKNELVSFCPEDQLTGKQNALEIAEALEAADRDERHRLASEFADEMSALMEGFGDEPREDS